MRVHYRLNSVGGGLLAGLTRGLGKRTLEMRADGKAALPVVVVLNPQRLPLHARDGQVLVREVVRFTPDEWQIVTEFSLGRGQRGYLRLFADVAPDVAADVRVDIAVLDPPLSTLRK